jgi:ANTAR domain/GAF domain
MINTEHLPPPGEDPTAALTADFAQTASALMSAGTITGTLQQVVDLAVATIEGCDFAGIFLVDGGVVTTRVLTDPVVAEIDALQHDAGEGPSLDAIGEPGTFYADDLTDDSRWTTFGPQAASAGIRSVLAMHLQANNVAGTLNLYARYPRAFGVIDRAKGLVLAALAGLAFTAPEPEEDETRRLHDMQWALATREVIGEAQGILMERERITSSQAFEILHRASQYLNIKLREVAQNLVDTGESPQTGSAPPP